MNSFVSSAHVVRTARLSYLASVLGISPLFYSDHARVWRFFLFRRAVPRSPSGSLCPPRPTALAPCRKEARVELALHSSFSWFHQTTLGTAVCNIRWHFVRHALFRAPSLRPSAPYASCARSRRLSSRAAHIGNGAPTCPTDLIRVGLAANNGIALVQMARRRLYPRYPRYPNPNPNPGPKAGDPYDTTCLQHLYMLPLRSEYSGVMARNLEKDWRQTSPS